MKRLLNLILPIIGKTAALKYILLGIITGLCSFLFINMVNRVLGLMIAEKLTVISKEYMMIFIAIILTFIWSKRALSLTSIRLSLRISWYLRKQIISLTLKANYQQLSTRISQIQTAILADVGALTNASLTIIDFSISTMLAICCFFYLASLSLALFGITVVTTIVGILVYYLSSKRNFLNLERGRKLENQFQLNLNAVIDGFKELFMDPRKSRYFFEKRIRANADESFKENFTAITGLVNNQMTGQILFYMLISSVLLVFSINLHIKASNVVSFIFTLIYLLGSVESIMVQLPTLMKAGVASHQLVTLTNELLEASSASFVQREAQFNGIVEYLEVQNLEFFFSHASGSFEIGPLNIVIRRGESIFIYGENGSGKTTFIYTLLGLYKRSAGQIKVNDCLIDDHNYLEYKNLFSVVFNDFYLFDELLIESTVNPDKWIQYLQLFELEGKVSLKGNELSTTQLSTGQRKRLAMIIALLEEKPILLLDEWAADQDPYFRKKFYSEIIPFLSAQGVTIIAITHDDKYFHHANRIFQMKDGQLLEDSISSIHRINANTISSSLYDR